MTFRASAILAAACLGIACSSVPEPAHAPDTGFERLSPQAQAVIHAFAAQATPTTRADFASFVCTLKPGFSGCGTTEPDIIVGVMAPGARRVVALTGTGHMSTAIRVGQDFILPLPTGAAVTVFEQAPNGTYHAVTFSSGTGGTRTRMPAAGGPISLGLTQGDPATGDVDTTEEPLDQTDEDEDGLSDLDDQDDDGDGVDDDVDADDDGDGIDDDAQDMDEDDDGEPDLSDDDDDGDGVDDDVDPDEAGDSDGDGVDDVDDVDDDDDGVDDDQDDDDDGDGVEDEDETGDDQDDTGDDTGA